MVKQLSPEKITNIFGERVKSSYFKPFFEWLGLACYPYSMAQKSEAENLNPAQERAVLTTEGPLLIMAGAGSGKTKVLTHRIAHLIEKGVSPGAILAVTFTNKAAEEMRERVMKLISRDPKRDSGFMMHDSWLGPWVGTFHALCVYILRESGREIGIPKSFSILDEEDALSLIKQAEEELALDPKQFQPTRMRALISRKKNELETAEKFRETARDFFPKIMANVWELYEEKKKASKGLDFDDLLSKVVELFGAHPDTLDRYQERWKYIHVDEYQDTNLVQYHLTSLLAKKYRNICVVGDIDQAIYSWRGADFRNILHFERDYKDAILITLEENYRSTQLILDAANAVIVKNKMRVEKSLRSQKKEGAKISLFEAANEEEEAEFIAELAHALIKERGVLPQDIAVLYRTNFQSRVIEEKMLERNIAYQVVGVRFYERREIKDALSYLRAALNADDLVAKKRIVNMPPRGIGKVLTTKYLAGDALKAVEAKKLQEFQGLLEIIKEQIAARKPSVVIKTLLEKTGLLAYYNNGTEEGEMRKANLEELLTLAKRYDARPIPDGIAALLEDAALMSDQDTVKAENSVKLMTVHAAKGLEFKMVFIAGLEEGLFPHQTMSGEEVELRQEEERRLFYVALTRAKEKVFLSYAVFRTIFGSRQINRPSTFLFDIPRDLLERAPEKTIMLE